MVNSSFNEQSAAEICSRQSSINVAVLRPLKVGCPGSHAEMYMESPLQGPTTFVDDSFVTVHNEKFNIDTKKTGMFKGGITFSKC